MVPQRQVVPPDLRVERPLCCTYVCSSVMGKRHFTVKNVWDLTRMSLMAALAVTGGYAGAAITAVSCPKEEFHGKIFAFSGVYWLHCETKRI